ncbi:MAG: hypothetical protein M1443_08340, partial [Nitrospirae bacterium]|nr:hypothetical protein [Nitrospirota bacterium]
MSRKKAYLPESYIYLLRLYETACLLLSLKHKWRLFMNLKEVVFMVEEDPEGGYAAKALGYPIFT